ncbi:MAG: NADH-ubiquinone oxidoreductase-F iron-sulfur binding region domain-containing protein [Solirubrobacteraceae bacterium]
MSPLPQTDESPLRRQRGRGAPAAVNSGTPAPRGLPRVLAGLGSGGPPTISFEHHRQLHGRLVARDPEQLITMVEQSGLRGRGGAHFPTGKKLLAVRGRRRFARRPSAVVVNGSETEPLSGKDRVLLGSTPHLVLDGAIMAARATGAQEVIVKVNDHGDGVLGPLVRAIQARTSDHLPISLAVAPASYVSGEEGAVINFLETGVPLPTFGQFRPFERGYQGRPTLIQNPETLAHLALIARHGARWYRELGTAQDPGTTLITLSGAVAFPGVYEVEIGTPVGDIVRMAGGATEALQALLFGGYFGTWARADAATMALPFALGNLKERGLSLGTGVIFALGLSSDGLAESARIATYLARESAGQCGPCVHGLSAIAQSLTRVAQGGARRGELEQLWRWCADVDGRGACAHPNGAVRFVRSSLDTFLRIAPSQADYGTLR